MSSDKEFDEPVVDGSARSLLRYARWLEAKGDPRGIHLRLDLARVPELRPPSDADDVELYTNEDWLKIDPRPPVTTRADGVWSARRTLGPFHMGVEIPATTGHASFAAVLCRLLESDAARFLRHVKVGGYNTDQRSFSTPSPTFASLAATGPHPHLESIKVDARIRNEDAVSMPDCRLDALADAAPNLRSLRLDGVRAIVTSPLPRKLVSLHSGFGVTHRSGYSCRVIFRPSARSTSRPSCRAACSVRRRWHP